MIKLFLEIFTRLKSIFKNILTCFSDSVSDPGQWLTGQVGRPHGRPNQGPVDRRAQPCARLAGNGPVDRAVDRRAQTCARLLAQWSGRPAGRPDQRALLSVSGRSTERSTGFLQRSYL